MDVAFVIGASSPYASESFAKIKEIVQEVVKLYGVQRVYYSVILVGRDPTVRINFSKQYSEAALKATIAVLSRPTDGPSLHSALQKAQEVFAEGGRPDAKKVVVVILDEKSGSSIEDVKNAAGKLEEDFIKVIAVALGYQADPDETAATTTNKENVVEVDEFDDPEDAAEEITLKISKGKSSYEK